MTFNIGLIFSTITNLFLPLISKNIMDQGFLKSNFVIIVTYITISSIVIVVNKILNVFKEKLRADVTAKISGVLYGKVYDHITKIKIEYFNGTNHAELLNNINVDIGNITRITDSSLFFVITSIFSMIGGVIGLLMIEWKFTMLVLCFDPIKYIVEKRKKLAEEKIKSSSEFAQWFGDTVGGMKEIHTFGILSVKRKEFNQKISRVIDIEKRISILGEWNMAWETILLQVLVLTLYIIGANMVFNFNLTIGSIFAFITYSGYVINPIFAILNIGYMFSGIIPSTKRYYEFLEVEKKFNITIPQERIITNKFDSFNNIVSIIETCSNN